MSAPASVSTPPADKNANTKTVYSASVEIEALPLICLRDEVLSVLRVSAATLDRLSRAQSIYRPDRAPGRGSQSAWSRRRVRLMALTYLGMIAPDEAMALYRRGTRAELTELSSA